MSRYEKALELFGIESGFVDTHLDEIYAKLKAENNPEVHLFLSPEYMDTSKKYYEILHAYYILDSIFKNYILGSTVAPDASCEKLEEETLRLLYDSVKGKRDIDEYFIAELIEIIVSNLGLNAYVRRIEFQYYDKSIEASYSSESNHLIVYLSSIKETIRKSYDSRFSSLEKDCHPYGQIIYFMRHEIEHAEQKRMREQKGSDIYTRLSLAREVPHVKRDQELERIVRYPVIISNLAFLFRRIRIANDYRKYRKYWNLLSTERIADVRASNLVLNLLDRASTEFSVSFPTLEEIFMDELRSTILSGYDKTPAPMLTYLEKFKQYGDCLEIMEMTKGLSLAERLVFGLEVSSDELDSFLENSSKVMKKVRTM